MVHLVEDNLLFRDQMDYPVHTYSEFEQIFNAFFGLSAQVVPGDVVPRGARAPRGARVRDHRVQEPRDRADARRPARPAHPEALPLAAGRVHSVAIDSLSKSRIDLHNKYLPTIRQLCLCCCQCQPSSIFLPFPS